MPTPHARATAITMTCGALLAGSILTATPAAATLTNVTPTTCAAEGGTYSRVKGVNTCVVNVYDIRYEYPNMIYNATVWGPFENPLNHPADGYYAEWRLTQGFRDTITYTQKGKRPAQSTTDSVMVSQSLRDATCNSLTVYPGIGVGYGFAYYVQCDSLGMFPQEIYLP